MIPGGPRQEAQAARPGGGKQRQAAANHPPQDQAGRRPAFAVEIWASPWLRDQNPGRPLSLEEALGRGPAPRKEPDSDPEPEPEP